MKNYSKPALSFEQQVDKLEARGLIVTDRINAAKILTCISYYRFSGYCYPFRQRDQNGQILDDIVAGTSWEEIVRFLNLTDIYGY
jgi:abortive infection bacteriophage resistance protein